MKPYTHNKQARRDRRRASVPRKGQKSRKDREIARLRRELTAERRKTASLERKLAALQSELKSSVEPPFSRFRPGKGNKHSAESMRDASGRRARRYRKSSFFRYLWDAVTDSAPIAVLTKLMQYFRRIRVAQIVLSVLLAVSAFTAMAVLSAVVIPFLLMGTAILTAAAAFRSHRMNIRLKKALTGKRIRILIPPGKSAFSENAFFIRNAREMAQHGEVAVIAVSPYLLSTKGLGGRGAYSNARQEADNLFIVRRHYFFTLRRRVLDTLDGDITIVY